MAALPVLRDGWCSQWMHYLNPAVSIDWRVSLVPAAAVIPAPVAYTNIAAVKKLVVECRADSAIGLVPFSDGVSAQRSVVWF
jgi:hypothetical protein